MVRPTVTTTLRGAAVLVAAGLVAAWPIGCGGQPPATRHEIVTGVVEGLRTETGQLTVRTTGMRHERDEEPTVSCLLTSDAEVYINDKFSRVAALTIGDTVELIGYPDPGPRAERFLVLLAHVTRPEPLPPAPDLEVPASQPQEN